MLKRSVAMFVVGASVGFGLAVASCSSKPSGGGDGGTNGGGDGGSSSGGACTIAGGTTCASLGDCPSSSNFKCDPASNCCVFFCQGPSDCGGQYDQGDPCKTSALGCICDQGVCKSKQCSSDADCGASGSQVCKDGSCVSPDPASAAATVVVQPNPAVLHVGVKQQFSATVLDSSGKAVILAPGTLTWSVTPTANGSFDAAGTGVFTPSTASTAVGDTTITATAGSVKGTATATIYAAPTTGTTQITLIDGQAGVPITDATVQYSDASGTLIPGTLPPGSSMGVYTLPALPTGAALLNVFEPNYQYVSIAASDLPTSGDLVLFLAQNPVSTPVAGAGANGASAPEQVVGGYTGDFVQEPGILDPNNGEPASEKGDIHFGVAGTAIPQNLLDVSVSALLGPTHDVTINIGGSHTVGLPQGIELGFGSTYFKCSYDGLGAAGGCGLPLCTGGATSNCLNTETDPTKADWAQSVFACGNRPAWGLGGGIPFSAISAQLGNLSSGNASIGAILTAILPDFSSFNSGVFFQVPYTMAPPVLANTVNDSCTGKPFTDSKPIPDPSKLNSNVTLSLDTPLALSASVTLPALPTVGGKAQQDALVLAGSYLPGYGLLPLGLSAGTTLDSNNNPSSNNKTCDTDSAAGSACNPDGHVTLHLAPAHGGAERNAYGVVALVLDVSASFGTSSSGSSSHTALAGLVQTFPASKGLPYNSQVNFGNGTGSFLPYAESASWTAASRTYTNQTVAGASWMRLRFEDDQARQWVVYFDPAATNVKVPAPPASMADRTANSDGSPATPAVQAVEASGSLTLQNFLDFGNSTGVIATDVIDHMAAFNSYDL